MATQNVDILQVNTAPSVKSVADLKREIKELKGQLLGLEQGTAEYNKVLTEVANKTHDLKEVQEQVNRSSNDFGDRLANVRGTVMGLTGAFQTVLGSLSLIGVNLGDDVKMLKMLNSAMAITQGVAAIDSGVKAFKALTISIKASTMAMSGLKKALITSGIGAAAIAVGVLVSKLSEMKSASEEAIEKAKQGFDALKGSINSTDRELARLLKRMKAEGASVEDIYNVQLEDLKKKEQELTRYIQSLSRAVSDGIFYKTMDKKVIAANKKLIDEAMAERAEINEKIKDLDADYYADSLAAQQTAEKKRLDDLRKAWAKEVAARQDSMSDLAKTSGGAELTDTQQGDPEAEQRLIELQALTDYYTKRAEIVIANEKDIDDQLLVLDIEYRDTREELLRTQYEDGLITKQDFDNQMAQLEVEAAEFQIEQEERVTAKIQEETEKRKAAQQAWAQSVKVVATSVSSILGTLGENLEEGTRQWKNLKTAQAVIDTIAGSVTAFMTTMQQIGGIPGLIAGAAAAAATLAAGMVEVNKIKSTTVSKGSAASASGGSSLGSVSASAVSVNAMQVTPTRQVQTQEDVANMPDTRVYVLERDITDTQRRVAVTTQNATY